MPDATTAMFAAHAEGYDGLRRALVPCFDDLYGGLVDALDLAGRTVRDVLDLGAGTGLVSRLVRERHPDARLTLLDGADTMLEQARAALPGAAFVLGDLADPLPEGRWDAVVSALAIHHLDDDAKRALFARVHDAMAPGGVFVNAEQVAAPTPRLEAAYLGWHERSAKALGATDADWTASLERMRHDRCATVEDQLRWLREAGFTDVDCPFRQRRFAVLVAVRG